MKILVFTTLLFTGCALLEKKPSSGTSKTKASPAPKLIKQSADSTALPEWVSRPQAGCFELKELCTVGQGRDLQEATLKARQELASFLQSKISSEFSSRSRMEGEDFSDEQIESLVVHVNGVIQGAKLKRSYNGQQGFFSQVSLQVREAEKILAQKIKDLDQSFAPLLGQARRSRKSSLTKWRRQRAPLEASYQLITRKAPPKAPDNFREDPRAKNRGRINILLTNKEGLEIDDLLRREIQGQLSDRYYFGRFTKGKRPGATLEVRTAVIKEYLNVSGFEKYQLLLFLTLNPERGASRALKLESTQVGRSKKNALQKAFVQIKAQIDKRFNEILEDL